MRPDVEALRQYVRLTGGDTEALYPVHAYLLERLPAISQRFNERLRLQGAETIPCTFAALTDLRAELATAVSSMENAPPADSALSRLLDLELAIVLESYVTEQRRNEHQARLASLGSLAAGLAHEIRNPLNGALLNVSFVERSLVRSGASAEVLEAAHVVKQELKRLAKLVTEFLEFARPGPLSVGTTSLRALCERVVRLMSMEPRTTVTIRVDLPAAEVVVPVDETRLERALVNVLENAIDAVTPDGGTVVVRAHREEGRAWIEVEDDGPGLSSADAPIFDAFFSTKPNGTGLGLAVAHRAVADHGGTIEVESKPGRTRFRIALPLHA